MYSIARTFAVAVTVVGLIVPTHSHAQTIDIKGLRVGMPKAEVQEKFPAWKDFTVAGVKGKYQHAPVNVKYRDDQLDQLTFFFDSASFETVLSAVRDKYPNIKCDRTSVANAMGAAFEQLNCSIQDSESLLQLTRYVSDIRTSVLSIMSNRSMEELDEKAKQKKKDI